MHAAAILYLALFLFLIYRNGFFGIFKDDRISSSGFTILFLLKALAIVCFSQLYLRFYGGLENFDAGIFFNDAREINLFARSHPMEYLKLLAGLQDDAEGSYLYDNCLVRTYNWDNGKVRDFFYNDNRVVIRVHSLLHFIAFDSYYVHALFNCFLSFIGIRYLYQSLKEFFIGRELWLLLILCFFPTLWFYTGALLKEGLALFVLGCSIYHLRQIIYRQGRFINWAAMILLLFVSCFLKPYLLCFAFLCFTTFFIIHRYQARFKVLLFASAMCIVIFSANILCIVVRDKSLSDIAFARQRVFADAAKGGIFLMDSIKFVRLEFDSDLVRPSGRDHFTIKKDVPYIYWEHSHQQDTLFCGSNADTLTRYQMVYQMPESGSNIGLNNFTGSYVKLAGSCLYYSLLHPFFVNAKGPLQQVASFENLLIAFSIMILLLGSIRNKKDYFPPLIFVFFALSLCMLVGLTTPNSGAIFRYRSPAVIFLLASALYYSRIPAAKKAG